MSARGFAVAVFVLVGLLGSLTEVSPGRAADASPPQKATPDPVEAALTRMHAGYQGVGAVRARFRQTSTGMSFVEPLVQTGSLSLEAPRHMRWDFETPRRQSYVSDGATLWLLDEADRTATVFKTVDGMLQRFYGFLTGTIDLRADFKVTLGKEGAGPVAGTTALTLTPRAPDGSIDSLRIDLDAETGRVVAITMWTPFGDRTETVLSDVTTPTDLPDTDFAYTARDGWRTIRGD